MLLMITESGLVITQYFQYSKTSQVILGSAYSRILVFLKTFITFLSLYYVFSKASKPLNLDVKKRFLNLLKLSFAMVVPANVGLLVMMQLQIKHLDEALSKTQN